MIPELLELIRQAEDQYLQDEELDRFSVHVSSLEEKLAVYEILRDQELQIFQPVADKVQEMFPKQNPKQIEISLKHWLLITRYCAMAMLLNNTEFLQHRLLEWMTDIVQAHGLQTIENTIYQVLLTELGKVLTPAQLNYLEPFFELAKTTLLEGEIVNS
jgi:hypothetical protein